MQFRGLLVAVIALAVLGAGVYFSNKAHKDDDKKESKDTPKILSIPEDQIQQISLTRKDGKNTVLKRTGDKWQITAPETLAVDQDAVSGLTAVVSSLTSERVVEENTTDFATFGLTAPQLEVAITKKDGKVTKLVVGDDTAMGNGAYARLAAEPKVYIIPTSSKTSLDKTVQDLRDRRLLTFDADKLTRVEVAAKGATAEFGKNNQNEWQLVKPKPFRADNWAVEELVRKVKDAKMDATVSEEDARKAAANFTSGAKVATVRLTDATGTQELEVRKKDKDYFAKGSAIPGFHKVPNDLGDGLDKSPDDFRNKKLFDFGFNDPTRLEVKSAGQSKTYQKTGEKWTLDGKEMDSVSIQSFIDKLRDLAATKFLDSGFTTPSFEIKLTAKDGKIVDHIQFSQSGNAWYGIRANEPAVYEVDPGAVVALQQTAADIKPPSPPKPDAKKK